MVMSNITVEGIDPDCKVLGADQKFIYGTTDAGVKFRAYSQFVPTVPNDSVIDTETRNVNLSGYRWRHTTKTTDVGNYGRLKLQYFANDGAGTDLLEYDQTSLNLSVPITSSQTTYGRRPGGALFMNGNTTDTASLTGNAPTKVLGNTTSSNLIDFSMFAHNRLTYVPSVSGISQPFIITANITFQNMDTSAGVGSFYLYKNGTTPLGVRSSSTMTASSTNQMFVTVQTREVFAPNDYVEVWCSSSVNSTAGIRALYLYLTLTAA
jgi:hypothetical protein